MARAYAAIMSIPCAFTRFLALLVPELSAAQMADVSCDDTVRMTHTLTKVLGAERQGMGLRDPETILEVCVTAAAG